jgi:hypothetical protein
MEVSMENQYKRINAVHYALKYALKPNPNYRYFSLTNTGGDCSNFISQCLLAGGVSMNSTWWYKKGNPLNTNGDTWSFQWSIAGSLYFYLRKNEKFNLPGPKGTEIVDKQILEIGDLIYFEDNKGNIFHSAIITSTGNEAILISQHSFEALNIPYQKSWEATKLHFLKISF